MKKIILFSLIVMTGCLSKEKKNLKPSHDSKLAVSYGMSTKISDLRLTATKSAYLCANYHRITFDEACNYVSAFLSEANPYTQDTTYGMGGYMDSSAFDAGAATDEVIQFFPCFDSNLMEVFLCYKDLKSYVSTNSNQCDLTDNEVLEQSTNQFVYDKPKTQVSASDVANFISTMKTGIDKTHSQVAGKDVKVFNPQFFVQYNVNGKDPNIIHCGAMNKCEVLRLLNQTDSTSKTYPCVGIRYFFGYDDARNNKIRLVLIGVNADGSNLIHFSTGEDAVMLEKEWPPDTGSGVDSTSAPHH